MFNQIWSTKTHESLAVKFAIYNNEVIAIKPYPVIIEDFGQPRLASNKEKAKILSESTSSPVSQNTP